MKQELPTVIVSIPWSHTIERVRLDLSALKKRRKGRICTRETFRNGEILQYQPRITYRKRNNGDHVIELEYLKQDHSFPKRAEVFWGCSTITVVKALTSAKADWKASHRSMAKMRKE